MQEISHNPSPVFRERLSLKPVPYKSSSDSQNKKIKRITDRSFWTLEESEALKRTYEMYGSLKKIPWTCIRRSLESEGIFKKNKQIITRWKNIEDPKVISTIMPIHKSKILWLIFHFESKWAKISNFLKIYNNGYYYSDNAIKNFYNLSLRSKKHKSFLRELQSLTSQYSCHSEDLVAMEFAKSLQLDRLKQGLISENELEEENSLPLKMDELDHSEDVFFEEEENLFMKDIRDIQEVSEPIWDFDLEDIK